MHAHKHMQAQTHADHMHSCTQIKYVVELAKALARFPPWRVWTCTHALMHSCTQIKYVVELAKALARIPSVARVDLLTRHIEDPSVDASYGKPEESLKLPPIGNQPAVESGADGSMGGAYIVRLPCGPSHVYLK